MAHKVFVIGSNSFSGSNAVKKFISEGFEVFGVSRSDEPSGIFLPYKWDNNHVPHFKFSKIDLNTNIDTKMNTIYTNIKLS